MTLPVCKCAHAHALCVPICHPVSRGPGRCDYTATCERRPFKIYNGLRYCHRHWCDTLLPMTDTELAYAWGK